MLKNEIKVAFVVAAAFLVSCAPKNVANYDVVPAPQKIEVLNGGVYELNSSTTIVYPEGNVKLEKVAQLLSDDIFANCGYKLAVSSSATQNSITLALDASNAEKEGYIMNVTKDGVVISGGSESGVFYGTQTLRKSIPASSKGMSVEFPLGRVVDAPRFGYRGMMLDVSRHFEPLDSVKKLIDILALHNLNTLHFHLTDDQGWRVEIKKYPKLTTIGAKRDETVIGRNSGKYDGIPYGEGLFYTQDELKDLVAYASERFVTIVPEIDLPGHQLAALAAYPEFGCEGGPYKVWTQWGVSDDVMCAGNEKSMQFLEDVLGEIIEIFPSQYIHVGGDECPKIKWKTCAKCQARIKNEKIKGDKKHTAEEYLQSSVIGQMERFVESKGRHIIGWDEILEGGLTPNATVMSWRGIQGGIEAAKQGNNAIMTPNQYLYFDYYQTADTSNEPLAIGGFVPMSQVYGYEPVAESLTPEEAKHIIGVQANLWCEYIPNFNQLTYMILPRMAALSEVQWSNKDNKNYEAFLSRCARLTDHYARLGYNFAKHIFDVNAVLTPNVEKGCLDVSLTSFGDGQIYYSLDGSEPTSASLKYESPLEIRENCTVKAVVIRPTGNSRVFSEKVNFSKSSMKSISLKSEPDEAYRFNGAIALVDGLKGADNFKTGRWLGFSGRDIEAVVNMGAPTEISSVSISTNVVKGDWIMDATGIVVKIVDENQNVKEVGSLVIEPKKETDRDGVYDYTVQFDKTTATHVEVTIKNGLLPEWHSGAGRPAYIFVDEIQIN